MQKYFRIAVKQRFAKIPFIKGIYREMAEDR